MCPHVARGLVSVVISDLIDLILEGYDVTVPNPMPDHHAKLHGEGSVIYFRFNRTGNGCGKGPGAHATLCSSVCGQSHGAGNLSGLGLSGGFGVGYSEGYVTLTIVPWGVPIPPKSVPPSPVLLS